MTCIQLQPVINVSALLPLYDLYKARLNKTRCAMIESDTPALLILDPINILYATGASNMTLFSMRTPARYLLLFAEGPAILYDYFGCEHLSADLPTIDEVRPASGLCFTSSNGQVDQNARIVAKEVMTLMQQHLGKENRLAIDRFPFAVIDALRDTGLILKDADPVFYHARKNKHSAELAYMREAMRRVERAVEKFEQAIEPGRMESEVWAEIHKGLVSEQGQYISTRLMQSGSNTYPYFKECGNRILQQGDLVCLDTDALGYEGYAVDFSRSYLCGEEKPSADQQLLFERAREQLEHNVALVKPGKSYEEIADAAWQIPEAHQDSRYYCIGHGLGMSGERPNIPYKIKNEPYALEGVVEAGMVLCIESYIGSKQFAQGVKLEQQLLVTETGVECMSQMGFDHRFEQ